MNGFPDVETALLELFADLATCGTATPSDFGASSLPFIRVIRIGGGDDRYTDSPRIGIDAFGADRMAAYNLAESVRQMLLAFPLVVSAGVIDRVITNTGPMEVDWGNINIRRFYAAYTVLLRR